MEGAEESVTVSHLQGLIKQKRNAELRSLLLQEVPASLINKRESTLMHAAVTFNNIDVIALLFGLGFNINARDSISKTPLMLAAQNNSYQAVQLLLALDADVFIADDNGANALQVLLEEENNTPTHIIGNLFERLRRNDLSCNDIVENLVKANCPLEHILMFNDAEITQKMLVRTNEKDEDTLIVLLKRAMYTMDMANARLLLEYKPHLRARRKKFFDEVTKDASDPTTKPFFEQLINWNVIDQKLMDHIEKMFRYAGNPESDESYLYQDVNENVIKSFLDIGIDKYSKEKFGCALIVSLCANTDINVINLLKNRHFDVDGRDKRGDTALHVAIEYYNREVLAYLLDIGADPNIRNVNGILPINFVDDKEMTELLLEADLDMEALVRRDHFILYYFNNSDIVKAKVMILEFQGLLSKKIHNYYYGVDSSGVADKRLQEMYDKYIQDLDWMNNRLVSESISLFFVLKEKFDRLARYVKDKKTCTEIRSAATSERKINPEYSKMLIKNLNKACKLNKLKSKAAKFLCAKMQISDCDHLVIEKIIGFLTYSNLLVFEEMKKI